MTASDGTIGRDKDHRVRLTDADIGLIVSALRARAAMLRGERYKRTMRLALRLSEMTPGNPNWSGIWSAGNVTELTQPQSTT